MTGSVLQKTAVFSLVLQN